MIEATTEINAPAWFVRDMFLDFPNMAKWHSGQWIQSITLLTPGKTSGSDLVAGDMMRTVIPGMQFDQTIQVNEPDKIVWVGPWYGLLTGTHGWDFTPIAADEPADASERCSVRQWETFTGMLSPFMSNPNYLGGKKTLEAFVGVNEDLKRGAETAWAARSAST